MSIHFVSYGDDKYKTQKQFLNQLALASNFFDEVNIYGPEIIDDEFFHDFKIFLNQRKGGGYWIWKPYLIKKELNRLAENDILVYCDAGCVINDRGKKRYWEYISLLEYSTLGSLAFELPLKEEAYTKQEVFDYFEVPDSIKNSNQLMATVILLKKCSHTASLIDKWYSTLLENPLLFTDDIIRKNQSINYIDHRHDQSIFSVIRKLYGTQIIADETYFLDFVKEGQDYPFWAARLR